MAIQTRTYLRSRFQTGDTPTQQDFYDLIDSMLLQDDVLTYDGEVLTYDGALLIMAS